MSGQTRRSAIRSILGAGIALSGARAASANHQQYGVDSGGLGLLRRDFEAAYGTGVDAQHLTIYDDVTIGVPGATMCAQFRGEVVDHIEVQWSSAVQAGGIDWGTAYREATFLAPVDAEYREQFWMPETPEGPVELVAHMHESAQLNIANNGLGRVLVVFQRRYVQLTPNTPVDVVVSAVTLTMAEVPQ